MMQRILVVLPMYGGSLPVGRYCVSALRELGRLVEVFEAPDFYGAFSAVQSLRVKSDRREYLENSFLQVLSQAIMAKVESFEPDLVLCLAQAPLNRQSLARLRRDGIPTAMWFVEDYRLFTYWRAFAPHYDLFAVIQKEPFFGELAAAGVANVLYLPLAAQPDVHRPLELTAAEKRRFGSELSFMGAGYPNRRAAFRHFARRDFKIWGTEWEGDAVLAPLVQGQGQRICTEDAVRIFNASTVNLNLHSSIRADQFVSGGDFVNPRTFEIAACGAFQLVDKRGLMPELFDGNDLATFETFEELQEKIGYFVSRPEERSAYAARGRARVLAGHTYAKRMQTLLDFAAERLPRRAPRATGASVWPEEMPKPLRREIRALMEELALPAGAEFPDVVAAVRQKSGVLSPLETAVLFLDEWKKQYGQ